MFLKSQSPTQNQVGRALYRCVALILVSFRVDAREAVMPIRAMAFFTTNLCPTDP